MVYIDSLLTMITIIWAAVLCTVCIGAPTLRDNLVLKIEENSENVPVNLLQEPTAYPLPSSFMWRKDGQLVDGSRVSLTYSNATFAKVAREDDGVYTVSATNFVIGSSTQQVGTDTGSFRLDVICKLISV